MACQEMEELLHKFESFTQKPVNYLTVQSGLKEEIKTLVKSLYDLTKSEESKAKKSKKSALPELIIQDFDEEQIWQEIELQNSECWDQFVWDVANCMSSKNDLKFPVETSKKVEDFMDEDPVDDSPTDEDEDDELSEETDDELSEETDADMSEKVKEKAKPRKVNEKKIKSSIVDDKFFKLQEMEQFLLSEERKDGKTAVSDSDEESIDLFEYVDDEDGDSGEEEGGKDMMYSDFFDGQEEEQDDHDNNHDMDGNDEAFDDEESEEENQQEIVKKPGKKSDKKVTFANTSSHDDSDDSSRNEQAVNGKPSKDEKKSDFEERQQRLQQTITRLEEKNFKEAPWQLKGEVDASKRPQNSLLEEVVDFDLTSRPAPIITEQTTLTLEDIIKQRIKDKAWDDVVRKEKPVEDQLSFRKTEIIDHAKSKQSLAQVYEAEYLKQKQALSGDAEEEKEPESHTQIREAMSKLFSQLDALSHYHYTPKAPQAEVKIVSNTPAISMEEVAPVATSDAALLAPEEVKKKRRGDLISKDERTQTDKNRERRKKKKLQKSKGQVEKVTNNRNTKTAVEASDKSLKTSKAFFQQLNDDATSLIKSKSKRNVKNKGQ